MTSFLYTLLLAEEGVIPKDSDILDVEENRVSVELVSDIRPEEIGNALRSQGCDLIELIDWEGMDYA